MVRKALSGIRMFLVGLAGCALVCAASGEVFINDSGFTARAFRIVFSSTVRITDFGKEVFSHCIPEGEGTQFLFSSGQVAPGHTFWLNWERTRSEVKVVKTEWLREVPSKGKKETVSSGRLRILFDQTRLQKLTEGSYDEGKGYQYAIDETAWYGVSNFVELLRKKGHSVKTITQWPITSSALNEINVLIILDPSVEVSYSTSEVHAIRAFVENGGGLFLTCLTWRGPANPSGGADSIARAFGASFKDNGEVQDATDHYGSYLHIIKIRDLETSPITAGVGSYYFQGTYLDGLGGASVLARTDEDAWFDHFGSDDWGDNVKQSEEEEGPFPVLASMEYGLGRVVFAGDAFSLVSNAWIDDLDAEKLALNIVGWLAFLEKEAPVARFSVAPTQPMVNLYTTFDASTSSVSVGAITDYTWRFGDGSTGSGKHIAHVYNSPGNFTVILTITNDYGASNSISKTITVTEANQPPEAGFTYSPRQPTDLDVIQFTDQSSDPDGQVVKWHWDFGDGNAGTEQNPSHRYEDEGTYKVTLAVTDDDGVSDSTSETITVTEADQPPQVTLIDFPELVSTGVETKGTIGFADPDGDISQAKFEVLEGSLEGFTLDLTQPPYADAVKGKIEGSSDFTIKVDQPGQYCIRVTMVDDAGLTSEPKEFSFEARTPTAPAITKIVFPSAIKVNQEQNGLVKFEDLDGDITNAEFEIMEGDPTTIEVKPGMSFDPGVQGRTKSSFRFSVIATKAQMVKLRLTLIDSASLKSELYEFTFKVE